MYVEHSSQMENFILLIIQTVLLSDYCPPFPSQISCPHQFSTLNMVPQISPNKHAQVKCPFSPLSTVAISYSSFYLHKPG